MFMISVLSAADLRLYSRRYRGHVHRIASHQALVRSASRAVCAMPVALSHVVRLVPSVPRSCSAQPLVE